MLVADTNLSVFLFGISFGTFCVPLEKTASGMSACLVNGVERLPAEVSACLVKGVERSACCSSVQNPKIYRSQHAVLSFCLLLSMGVNLGIRH